MMKRPQSQSLGFGRREVVIVAAVLCILPALMIPVFVRTYQTSLTLRCRQQLLQLFGALQNYAITYGGFAPCTETEWRGRLDEVLEPEETRGRGHSGLWTCPAGGGYIGNAALLRPPGRKLGSYLVKVEIGVLADGNGEGERSSGSGRIAWRHRGGANVAFIDGHVEWIPEESGRRVCRFWDDPR